ncbi:MAG TPA: ribonuclease PH [Actinomycetota bacterium]|nr:ribonuclease PH [Actinomycetota bacterium]
MAGEAVTRAPDELRPVEITRGFQETAEGSALIRIGSTRVLCAASFEETVPRFLRGTGGGWVTAEYSMLPRATVVRTPREVKSGRPSGRTQEIQRLIGRSLRAVTDLSALGENTITIDADVLLADGGTRCASITGCFVALYDACRAMLEAGKIERMPIREEVAAISVGIVDGVPRIDLDYELDVAASVDMNVVMTGSGRFVEVQGTAEGDPFEKSELDRLLELAEAGIKELIQAQRDALGI